MNKDGPVREKDLMREGLEIAKNVSEGVYHMAGEMALAVIFLKSKGLVGEYNAWKTANCVEVRGAEIFK